MAFPGYSILDFPFSASTAVCILLSIFVLSASMAAILWGSCLKIIPVEIVGLFGSDGKCTAIVPGVSPWTGCWVLGICGRGWRSAGSDPSSDPSSRVQRVQLEKELWALSCKVTQGLSIPPMLFNIYVKPL